MARKKRGTRKEKQMTEEQVEQVAQAAADSGEQAQESADHGGQEQEPGTQVPEAGAEVPEAAVEAQEPGEEVPGPGAEAETEGIEVPNEEEEDGEAQVPAGASEEVLAQAQGPSSTAEEPTLEDLRAQVAALTAKLKSAESGSSGHTKSHDPRPNVVYTITNLRPKWKFPPQVAQILSIFEADGRKTLNEVEVHDLMVAAAKAGKLRTKQSPFRIFQYYRAQMNANDVLTISQKAA